ncbi:MAG: hypothetical protein HOO86_15590 [Bacteroidales bacterium]|nr:hypothetical protein [Bacteroidales bacterium]
MLTKKNIFRITCILILGYLFLPIVFKNLFWPFMSSWFYIYGWIALLLFFYPRILISRPALYIYFFYSLYLLLILFDVYYIEIEEIHGLLKYVFISTTMLQYFYISKDYHGLNKVIRIALIFFVITTITSIIGMQKFPMAARDLAGALQRDSQTQIVILYEKLGIASYDFFYGIAFSLPIFVSLLKVKYSGKYIKIIIIFLIVLSFYGILKSQYTTPLVFAMLLSFFAYWTPQNIPKAISLYVLVALIFIISYNYITEIMFSLSHSINAEVLSSRLYDIADFMRYGLGGESKDVDVRLNRIPLQIENFLNSPIIGGSETTGHVFWIDTLARFGFLGLLPWILLLSDQIKRNLQNIYYSDRIYYILSILMVISVGFIRNLFGAGMTMFVFFVIPSLALVREELFKTSKE